MAKPDEIFVESSYNGPKLESIDEITAEWITTVMDWQRDQKKLHKKYVTMIIAKATEIFEKSRRCSILLLMTWRKSQFAVILTASTTI